MPKRVINRRRQYRLSELARLSKLSKQAIWKWIKSGKLAAVSVPDPSRSTIYIYLVQGAEFLRFLAVRQGRRAEGRPSSVIRNPERLFADLKDVRIQKVNGNFKVTVYRPEGIEFFKHRFVTQALKEAVA